MPFAPGSVTVNFNEIEGTPIVPPDYAQGPQGSPGPVGVTGQRGSYWWVGSGPPVATGSEVKPNDMYLDAVTGDVYAFS